MYFHTVGGAKAHVIRERHLHNTREGQQNSLQKLWGKFVIALSYLLLSDSRYGLLKCLLPGERCVFVREWQMLVCRDADALGLFQ